MKIFCIENIKVNFVDENNVFCGYSLTQDCCEYADWFIDSTMWSTRYPKNIKKYQPLYEDFSGWNFDKAFFKEIRNSGGFDEGGVAIFRIVKDQEEKFIHIFNSHNGYYCHGFEFKDKNIMIREGSI